MGIYVVFFFRIEFGNNVIIMVNGVSVYVVYVINVIVNLGENVIISVNSVSKVVFYSKVFVGLYVFF